MRPCSSMVVAVPADVCGVWPCVLGLGLYTVSLVKMPQILKSVRFYLFSFLFRFSFAYTHEPIKNQQNVRRGQAYSDAAQREKERCCAACQTYVKTWGGDMCYRAPTADRAPSTPTLLETWKPFICSQCTQILSFSNILGTVILGFSAISKKAEEHDLQLRHR